MSLLEPCCSVLARWHAFPAFQRKRYAGRPITLRCWRTRGLRAVAWTRVCLPRRRDVTCGLDVVAQAGTCCGSSRGQFASVVVNYGVRASQRMGIQDFAPFTGRRLTVRVCDER